MTSFSRISFDPTLPWWLLVALALLAAVSLWALVK